MIDFLVFMPWTDIIQKNGVPSSMVQRVIEPPPSRKEVFLDSTWWLITILRHSLNDHIFPNNLFLICHFKLVRHSEQVTMLNHLVDSLSKRFCQYTRQEYSI